MDDPARRKGSIGRERELGTVAGMLDRIAEGGQAQVIGGEPGIGKTSLLTACAEEARRRGVRALAARGAESERHLSFATLHDLKDQATAVPESALLSPQELQIARLAAKGLSNRDIGQQLYLSHRTIGARLYRIFPKLGITSRAQLHSVLPQEHLDF
jgi:DNA-binding NarL/FixJ family response regulator